MSVIIVPIKDQEQYTVNGHLVYKNILKNWSCEHDLTAKEHEAFGIYEKLVIKKRLLRKKGSYILEYTDSNFTIKYTED
ncbi:hypothetical protein [Flavobacterium sp. PL02]|uniref:hypothetical protein n=1 Tax=Flavobacterium sp. PL02 TaxID=3088354 RepID=UPI002B2327BA|nr:hypothetical protein [Flavobacterium sp. PL02]MEA9414238.1 hypothetical protein [Flavobacterium sp. PL02]